METIGSESAEANIRNQSVRSSSQINQTEQEAAMTAAEHKDEIRAVILIYPAFCIYDDVHEMFDSPEEIPETHSLLGLRLGNRYFVDIWDQEPYERIKEYGKNILLIHGDRDSIVPISYSDKLAETIDHVEYHVIRGADFDLEVS